MKKLITLILGIAFVYGCSSGSNDNSSVDNTLLMRKWYVNNSRCSNGNRNYHEFSAPNIYRHYVYPSSNNCNYILPEYGTFTRNGNTIVLKYDPSLGITDAILTIETLTASTFSFVATGAFGGHYVFTSY